nr:hypothetical protein Iba_chr13cCG11540 [Ipomoea batatas]
MRKVVSLQIAIKDQSKMKIDIDCVMQDEEGGFVANCNQGFKDRSRMKIDIGCVLPDEEDCSGEALVGRVDSVLNATATNRGKENSRRRTDQIGEENNAVNVYHNYVSKREFNTYFPWAVSPESIIASAPSRTAIAMSETSALVGVG